MSMNPNYTGMQKRKKVSLSAGFSRAVNLPRYTKKDGDFPLYPHGVDSKIVMKRPDGWHKAVVSNYNSPSNVRTVCLSQDAANVLYWAQPIKGGRLSPSSTAAGDYIFDRAEKAGIRQRLDATRYEWENAGLSALVNPVIFSNIEELWISAEIFNCPKYAQVYATLNSLQPGQVAGVDFLSAILEDEISTLSVKRTIAATFPLLRAIVVVKVPQGSANLDFHRCSLRTNRAKEVLEAKFPGERRAVGECSELMQELAQQTGFGFAVQPLLTGSILKFSLGDYKYDEQVLSGVRDRIIKQYTTKPTAVKKEEDKSKEVIPEKKNEPVKVVEEEITPVDTEYEGASLESIIRGMEENSFSVGEIKRSLWAYKLNNPAFYKHQVSQLPKDIQKKYADALK